MIENVQKCFKINFPHLFLFLYIIRILLEISGIVTSFSALVSRVIHPAGKSLRDLADFTPEKTPNIE